MRKTIAGLLLLMLSNCFIQAVLCLPSESGLSENACVQDILSLGTCTQTFNVDYVQGIITVTTSPNCYVEACVSTMTYGYDYIYFPCGQTAVFGPPQNAWGPVLCTADQITAECQNIVSTAGSTTNTMGASCEISVPAQSSANLNSGNLYHSQNVAGLAFSYNSIDPYDGPLGTGWTHNYNLSIVVQSNGSLVLKKGDGNNFYFTLTNGIYYPVPGSGDKSTIVNNTDGSYTRTNQDGTVQTFSASGNLAFVADRNGRTTILTYSGSNLTSITDPNGRVTTLATASGKVTSITAPGGGVNTLAYSGEYLTSITNPLGGVWQYTYGSNGMMLTKTDPLGNIVSYTYDPIGRLLTSTDPRGLKRAMNYTQNGNTTLIDKDGGVWTYIYDTTLLAKTQKTDPLGNVTKYVYDSNRNLTSETAPDGSVTNYTYDSNSNMTSVTDPAGNRTSYTYNTMNLVSSVADPKGSVTQYTYDVNGNMLTMTDPTGAVTQYQYDSRGNRISVTNPNNQTTAYSYDANNNLITVTAPSGALTTFTYDVMGNVLSQSDPLANTTSYTYDNLNRLTTVTDPKGNVTTYTYDPKGNKTSMTDANGNITQYAYTYDSQIAKVTNALNNATQLGYGSSSCPSCGTGADQLTSLTDAQGNITSFQYDLLGRMTQKADLAGDITSYTYDSKGNLLTKTDADENTIIYAYDLANRLTGKQYPDGSTAIYRYDQSGNIIYAGNQNIAYNLSYDADKRITGITDSLNRTIQYTYDAMGNRSTMTAPDGNVTNYAYDSSNRLYQITSTPGTFNFTYDYANRRTTRINPNGSTVGYTYDADSLLAGIIYKAPNGTILESFNYQYDGVGNRLTITDIQGINSYQYDMTYQLTQALHPYIPSETYTYDAIGNRLASTPVVSTSTNAIGTKTYVYDAENRLIRATMPDGSIAEYKYDPFGRRIEKDVTASGNTTVTKYLYDGANIIYEYDANNNVTNRYTQSMAIDDPLALQVNGQTYYYLKDALGTINGIADVNGNIVQSYTYDAYGNIQSQTGTIKQPFTFTGREFDSETGLYFYRARMYDATTGRFIQNDPLGFKGGDVNLKRYVDSVGKPLNETNLYLYTRNNPINLVDPLGLRAVYDAGNEGNPGGSFPQVDWGPLIDWVNGELFEWSKAARERRNKSKQCPSEGDNQKRPGVPIGDGIYYFDPGMIF